MENTPRTPKGIINLLMLISFVIAIAQNFVKALKDKKINFAEAWAIGTEFLKLPTILKNVGEVPAELADCDEQESNIVADHVADELDFPEIPQAKEKARRITDKALTAIRAILDLVAELRTIPFSSMRNFLQQEDAKGYNQRLDRPW